MTDKFTNDDAKRLRRVVNLLGLGSCVPESDDELIGCMFSVLGMVARAIEQRDSGRVHKLRKALINISDSKSLTATPAQFVRELQRMSNNALHDDAMAAPAQSVAQKAVFLSRNALHDKAWALYHAKTFDDTQLAKVNIHTIRAVFNAVYDALSAQINSESVLSQPEGEP